MKMCAEEFGNLHAQWKATRAAQNAASLETAKLAHLLEQARLDHNMADDADLDMVTGEWIRWEQGQDGKPIKRPYG